MLIKNYNSEWLCVYIVVGSWYVFFIILYNWLKNSCATFWSIFRPVLSKFKFWYFYETYICLEILSLELSTKLTFLKDFQDILGCILFSGCWDLRIISRFILLYKLDVLNLLYADERGVLWTIFPNLVKSKISFMQMLLIGVCKISL